MAGCVMTESQGFELGWEENEMPWDAFLRPYD